MTSQTGTPEKLTDASDEALDIDKSSESLCSVSAETYLSLPEEISALSSVNELKDAIENCKSEILNKPENSEDRKWLVRRLIELKLRLENFKDTNGEITKVDTWKESSKVILGHHFTLPNILIPISVYVIFFTIYCDTCSEVIKSVQHRWYICSDCQYKCHVECLSHVCRICAHVVVSENPEYILEICPEAEDGLANQNYRCAECLVQTRFTESNDITARLCDYTGKYYCSTCHWNSKFVIPARVIFNWDFSQRRVCRASKQILQLMSRLPILKLEKLNPMLFACIEELGTVKELRRQLMQIKKYLTSCKSAVEQQLLWRSSAKIHLLENEDSYSLQDLLDLRSGRLIEYLSEIRINFIRHIQVHCEVCKGRGFFCELCTDNKIIYPFEENVMSCSKCNSAFHFFCWIKNDQRCPKCIRIQERLLKSKDDAMSMAVDS